MKQSAGLLLYRQTAKGLEVLLVHPGGPFFKKKDDGAWTIPKGEIENEEDALATAYREFAEETGYMPKGDAIPLTTIKQKAGKLVHGWAIEEDVDINAFVSNTFEMEWPPHSGKKQVFPEIDRAEWFDLTSARIKINERQVAFLDELETIINK